MVPLHFVEGTRFLFFPNKRFLGFTCPVLGLVGCYLMHLSSTQRIFPIKTYLGPITQPSSVFGCVMKAKCFENKFFS